MEQAPEHTQGSDLRCTICDSALSTQPPASANTCQHRIDSIRFANFFWEEA